MTKKTYLGSAIYHYYNNYRYCQKLGFYALAVVYGHEIWFKLFLAAEAGEI